MINKTLLDRYGEFDMIFMKKMKHISFMNLNNLFLKIFLVVILLLLVEFISYKF